MAESKDITHIFNGNMPKKPKREIHVVKIQCLPFGFFEKQLWEYFTQFGKVIRARVARSLKTGNHKGWAYVGFEDKEVAEVAAETMNGYLMFEKRLLCRVMDKPPKCMLSGPRYVAPPHMKGVAKQSAKKQNAPKTEVKEDELRVKRRSSFKKLEQKLKAMGVEYDLSTVPYLTLIKQKTWKKAEEEPEVVAVVEKKQKTTVKTPNKKTTKAK